MKIRELMKGRIPDNLLQFVPRSFDIIGDIAIVDIPDEIDEYRKDVGNAILKINKNVSGVYQKASARKGIFRLRDLKYVCGSRKSVTIHKENGMRLMINVKTCYFSPREGTERLRISKSIEDGENVMVFFAGAGPFPIAISKHSNAEKIVGIEINPQCVKYFKKNVKLNKVENVRAVLGDVKKKYKNYANFDRVIMPLPETSWKFLNQAKHVLKRDGLINMYCIFSRDENEKFWCERVGNALPGAEIERIQKVLPFGPGKMKMRMDIRV